MRGTGRAAGFWHDSRTCRRLIAASPKSDDSISLIQCLRVPSRAFCDRERALDVMGKIP